MSGLQEFSLIGCQYQPECESYNNKSMQLITTKFKTKTLFYLEKKFDKFLYALRDKFNYYVCLLGTTTCFGIF